MDNSVTVPATDFVRKFGYYTDLLPKVNKINVTRGGKKVGVFSIPPEQKKKAFRAFAGSLKGTGFDNDEIWKEVFKRKSRKEPIIPGL